MMRCFTASRMLTPAVTIALSSASVHWWVIGAPPVELQVVRLSK
jgi:hypothetical protein